MLASHYAPGAAVRLDADEVRKGEALIRFGGEALPGEADAAIVLDLSPGGSLREAAANLFDYMKKRMPAARRPSLSARSRARGSARR